MKIYVTIGTCKPTIIDTVRSKADAEARIARFEREDRYSIQVEKYAMPDAWEGKYPVYTYGK